MASVARVLAKLARVSLSGMAEASGLHERIVRGTLGDIEERLAADPIERTALILVGRALAAEDFRESALYNVDYRRRFRGGAA